MSEISVGDKETLDNCDSYEYKTLSEKGKWLTFQKLNKPFFSEVGSDVSLSGDKGTFKYRVGDTIHRSKFRVNEAYVIKSELNNNQNTITSQTIRDVLKISFESYWCDEDEVYSPGLRGIYPISDKTGGDEDWSIMNYFDTKKEIHEILQNLWESENGDNLVEWLTSKFSNDSKLVESLVDRQWASISNGFKLESDTVNIFKNKFNITDISLYPPGSKIDRYGGIDMNVNGTNYQIKPGISTTKLDNGIQVNTYGMRDYQNKDDLDYILYVKGSDLIFFPNKNYIVVNPKSVIHYETPIINKIPQ